MEQLKGAVLHGHQVLTDATTLRVKRIEPEGGSDFTVGFAIVWTLFSACLLAASFAAQFGFVTLSPESSPGGPLAGMVMFGLFFLFGLAILNGAFESRYGEQEWIVSHNALQIQIRVFGLSRIHEFHDAKLQLFKSHGDDGARPCWQLLVVKGMKARHLIFSRYTADAEIAELQQLAALLSERTGWPLQGRGGTELLT